MTDDEKEKVVLRAAAIVCGFATWEEIEQQRLLERKNLETEQWQAYLERKKTKDQEKLKRFVRQQLRVSHIISEGIELDLPAGLNAEHKGFW